MFWIGRGSAGVCYGCSRMCVSVLVLVRLYWIGSVCSVVGAGVMVSCGSSGDRAGVLECVQVFWIRCGCSGLGAAFLEWVRLFWKRCGCSDLGAGVLVWLRVFWRKCECSAVGTGVLKSCVCS